MVLNILLILLASFSFTLKETPLYTISQKKANKILNKYWQEREFLIEPVKLEPGQPEIYTVRKGGGVPFAYLLFDEAPSKVDTFIYMVIFNPDGSIEKVSVLLYKENYGGEISSNRFLKQFVGKTNGLNMEYNKDIDGISGATISVRSITKALKDNSKSFSNIISTLQ